MGKGLKLNQCIEQCSYLGYFYAGRQYKGECYCGDFGYDKYGSREDCNACDSDNIGGYRSCVYFIHKNLGSKPTYSPTVQPLVGFQLCIVFHVQLNKTLFHSIHYILFCSFICHCIRARLLILVVIEIRHWTVHSNSKPVKK